MATDGSVRQARDDNANGVSPGSPMRRSPRERKELANPIWGEDWTEVRSLWSLEDDVAHLNHGSYGAVPLRVQRHQAQLREQMEANPVRWFRHLTEAIARAREALAGFLGADPEGTALVVNASAGVSTVLASLAGRLGPGGEVLLTDHCYGAVALAIARAARTSGASVVVADVPAGAPAGEVLEAVLGAVTERTRLAVLDHITSPTARLFPVALLVEGLHQAGVPVLVDGAHAPGQVPVSVNALGADFWVGNFHKWACAPRGTAALVVSPPWREAVRTLVVSWGELDGFPSAFDRAGTADLTSWLAAPLALELLAGLGWDRVRTHNSTLAAYGQEVVAEALGIPGGGLWADPGLSMRVVPLPSGVATNEEAARSLAQQVSERLGAEVAITAWRGRGLLRLSAHAYNSPADYERLATGLHLLLSR
jgi:isopenicillin-N epimerase